MKDDINETKIYYLESVRDNIQNYSQKIKTHFELK